MPWPWSSGRSGSVDARRDDQDITVVSYSQVDFRGGSTALLLRVASASGGGSIDVRVDGCDDVTNEPVASIGTCDVASTRGANTYAELSCPPTATSGPHDLCLAFSGDTSFEIDSWRLE